MEVNIKGTINLVTAVQDHNPKARFISVGSAEVYGPPMYLPIDEKHPLNPVNPYAISKAAADHYCAYISKATGMDIIRMRPFNHSGPGQADQFVLSSFARQIAEIEAGHAEPVLRVGNLDAARDFMHVNDVIRAYELAALHGKGGEAYNVCSGNAQNIKDALDILLGLSNRKISVEVDPERMRPIDVPMVAGSYAKLKADTGWEPSIPFEEVLSDLLDSWRKEAGFTGRA
jgi:GDP-4-dehydro-6-deoxy-D-mannose reductase